MPARCRLQIGRLPQDFWSNLTDTWYDIVGRIVFTNSKDLVGRRPAQGWVAQGFMTITPAAWNGAVSRVATPKPCAAAVAAM